MYQYSNILQLRSVNCTEQELKTLNIKLKRDFSKNIRKNFAKNLINVIRPLTAEHTQLEKGKLQFEEK
jgi:hypothetical protein